MRRVSFIILLFLAGCSVSAQEQNQNSNGKRNILKLNPLGLIPLQDLHSTLISYERRIGKKTSVQVNTIFNYINFLNFNRHAGIGIEIRQYFDSEYRWPQGIYGGVGGSRSKETFRERGEYHPVISNEYSFKIIIGKQWTSGNKILDANAGIKYKNAKSETFYNTGSVTKGFIPALNLGIGYCF